MQKLTLTTILSFLLATITLAQKIKVKSFNPLPNDLTARVDKPVTDQNGEKCALIKIETTQTGFAFEGGSLGITKTVNKIGEIWVYVPRGSKKITIKHAQLGVLRDYLYGQPITSATVYQMKLTTANVITTVEEVEIINNCQCNYYRRRSRNCYRLDGIYQPTRRRGPVF
ncbi:MAG: hypothetical protein B6I20_11860 [Bacteroidetes bacterium 4572_117]|nr:MAG: hypothetical protein B6I20_11860 [Bacteroidetes bacterium 4572_117]